MNTRTTTTTTTTTTTSTTTTATTATDANASGDNGGGNLLQFDGMKLARYAQTGGPVKLIGKRTVDGATRVYEIIVRRDGEHAYSEIRENGRIVFILQGWKACFSQTEHAAISCLHRILRDRRARNRHKRANEKKNRAAARAERVEKEAR